RVPDLVRERLRLVEPHARALCVAVLVVDIRESDERGAPEVRAAGRLGVGADLDETALGAAQLAQSHERPAAAEPQVDRGLAPGVVQELECARIETVRLSDALAALSLLPRAREGGDGLLDGARNRGVRSLA